MDRFSKGIFQWDFPRGFSKWVFQRDFPKGFSKWIFQVGFPRGFSKGIFQVDFPRGFSKFPATELSRLVTEAKKPSRVGRRGPGPLAREKHLLAKKGEGRERDAPIP